MPKFVKFLIKLKLLVHILLVLTIQGLPFFGLTSYGQTPAESEQSTIEDTLVSGSKSGNLSDSLVLADSVKTKDSLKVKSDIETTIVYSADDSITMDVINNIVFLYGNAKVDYGDISLEAEHITINWKTNILTAYPGLDSTGKKIGVPVFKQGEDVFVVDTIRYNAKTKKGLIKGIVTKQGEGYIHGEKVKKHEENLFISQAKYTTCDLAHPHFYIHAHKLKVIPNEKVVSGPFNMVVADVPTPLGFFLGYFPMPKKRKSGFIIPTIGSTANRGFSLRQGGYYWAANERLGIQVLGDAYANKSYRGTLSGSYLKRYTYQGRFAINSSSSRNSFEATEPVLKDINFQWNHSTLRKRNSNFQANVNAGSSSYFKRNSYNPTTVQQAAFSSSIMYYKAFGNSPFNINASLRQDQDVRTGVMNFTLPEVTANMNRIYPFKSSKIASKGVGNLILNNLSVQYTGNAKYFVTNDTNKTRYDSIYTFNGKNLPLLIDKAQYGAKHTIPIGTTIKFKKTFLKNFNFSPVVTFEDWNYQKVNYNLDPITRKVSSDTLRGLSNAYSYSGAISINTNIYGMYKFKSKKLIGIRHTINPILSFSYKPDFTNQGYQKLGDSLDYYKNPVYVPTFGTSPYGGPSRLTTNLLTFNINNILEAKTRSKKDTANEIKKFKILDQLSISGNYDFARDSFQLSPINLSGRSRIAGRIDIYGSAIFDPYSYVDNGTTRVRNRNFAISNKQGLAQLVTYNLSIGTNFNPDAQKKKNFKSEKGSAQEIAQINANPQDYVDFNIKWNLTVNYNLNYSKSFNNKTPNNITQAMNFYGDISLTERWKVSFNSGYDIQGKKITTTRIDIYRDLHCWQMALNIVPFGTYQSYGFTFNAKSSLLQDLKLSKRNSNYFGSYY